MIRLRRLIRLGRDEQGLSMIELMVALLLLSVAVFALIQVMGTTIVGTLRTRKREAAVALATKQIEQIRSNGYNNVYMKDGPTTWTDNGTTYTTLRNTTCTTCLTHSQTVTVNGFPFTVLQVVIGVDDAQDGTGASDADTNTLDFKRVIVQVSSSGGSGPAFTYTAQTQMHDVTKDPVTPVQGLHIELHNPDDGGAIIDDDAYDWSISISGAGILSQTIDEGVWNQFDIPVGSYTCVVEQTESSTDWYPAGSPSATSDSFSCAVTTNTVTTITRDWQQRIDCLVDATKTGNLWVKVVDVNGNPITTASVDPTPDGGQTPDPAGQTVGSNGEVVISGIPVGPYLTSVSATNYTTQSGLSTCVTEQDPPAPQLVTLVTTPPAGTTATVNVTVTYTGGGNKVFKVALEGGTTFEAQNTLKKNTPVTYAFTGVTFGTYNVTLYCQVHKNWNQKQQQASQSFVLGSPAYTRTFTESKC